VYSRGVPKTIAGTRLSRFSPGGEKEKKEKILCRCVLSIQSTIHACFSLNLHIPHLSPTHHVRELAMASMEAKDYAKIDLSTYKDIFESPKTFGEARNHPDEFQREKWRVAIMKEFDKMDWCKVWKKVKWALIPKGRRCVKHKWVFEWKRDVTA
jgi:hypothetical protein